MTLIERIKRLFHIGEKADNDIEPIETTDVSIIDTSDLEIDRNLTDDENESRKKLFEEVSSGNFSTFITWPFPAVKMSTAALIASIAPASVDAPDEVFFFFGASSGATLLTTEIRSWLNQITMSRITKTVTIPTTISNNPSSKFSIFQLI